jgi:hypothetical protein
MKSKIRLAIGALLGLALFTSVLPISGLRYGHAKAKVQDQETKDAKIKTGPEVAQRVNQLKQANKQVRNALKIFENNERKNGRKPKIEESWAITGRVASSRQARTRNCKSCPPLKKVGFHQDPASDDVIEIIFIPTYDVPGEWQGTTIFTLYDSAGNFLDQYIADVVLRQQDPAVDSWTDVYEVSFEGGQAWLQSDPAQGMIMDLNFQFGTPLDQQPDPSILPGVISAISGPRFSRKVSYSLTTMEPQLLFPFGSPVRPHPRVRSFLKCSALTCAAVGGLGCGVTSLLDAGLHFGPCAAGSCVGGAALCGLFQIFGS